METRRAMKHIRMKQSKEEMLADLKIVVKKRDELERFYDTKWQELLTAWDGKVMNKRFRDAVQKAIEEFSPLMSVDFSGLKHTGYIGEQDRKPYFEVHIQNKKGQYNYNDREQLWTIVGCRYDANYNVRISNEESKLNNLTIAWREIFTEETEEVSKIFEDYDKYLEIVENADAAIVAYNNLPSRFRLGIDTSYARLY